MIEYSLPDDIDEIMAMPYVKIPIDQLPPNLLLKRYLMSSYLYYVLGTSVYSDSEFDYLCTRLVKEWDRVDHRHKYLANKETIEACKTGFYIRDYPTITKHAAVGWLEKEKG